MVDATIAHAGLSDLELIVPLFDDYRQFYDQPSDPTKAREFLKERLTQLDSSILLARSEARAVGFAQLYPSFSSVLMRRLWILNDLYVQPDFRRKGIGENLLAAVRDHAQQTSAARLVLATATENRRARSLYEKQGWQLDSDFQHYLMPIDAE